MAGSGYKISAQLMMPAFAGERHYLAVEREMVRSQLERLGHKPGPWFTVAALGIYRKHDWERYLHLLDKYDKQLTSQEKEVHAGLMPVHFRAINYTGENDADIHVRLSIHNGLIRPEKKPPKRPERMDGMGDSRQKTHFSLPAVGGFARSGIKVTAHNVQAKFNRLGAYESALVVNKILYIQSSHQTRVNFEILSRYCPDGLSGDVEFPSVASIST